MSTARVMSSSTASAKLPYVRIRTNPPPPEQWTLVKEYNIEKRDNFTEWQRRLAIQLENMRNQLLNYSMFINVIDEEIQETRRRWQTSAEEDSNGNSDSMCNPQQNAGTEDDSTNNNDNDTTCNTTTDDDGGYTGNPYGVATSTSQPQCNNNELKQSN